MYTSECIVPVCDTNEPKRCPSCHQVRKAESYRSMEPVQIFPVKCPECRKDTEVPFEPRGGRPGIVAIATAKLGRARNAPLTRVHN